MSNDAFDLTLGYTYNYDYLPPLAMSDGLQWRNLPSLEWLGRVLEKILALITNGVVSKVDRDTDQTRAEELAEAQARAELLIGKFRSITNLTSWRSAAQSIFAELKDIVGTATRLQDYNELFSSIPLPPSAAGFTDDAYFASLRVAGYNPLVLRRVSCLPVNFPLTQTMFAKAPGFEKDDLKAALADKRLFLIDYVDLKLEPGQNPAPKQVYQPIGLFGIPKTGGCLRVIAIQAGQDPVTFPILCPGMGEQWQKAKTAFDIADANYHELISHLGRTHLLMEPFIVATHTQFHKAHPVRRLILPSLEGTDFINSAALEFLVNPGGLVDKLLMGTLESDLQVSAQSLQEPGFDALMLPRYLAERGLMDPRLIYPYRDDALLVWETIRRWVANYLFLFYKDDATVRADSQLQDWVANLIAEDGGRLRGFGQNGRIHSLAYLIDALTMILFTAGPQHAAVNFPQFELMSYAPAAPLAGYRAVGQAADGSGSWLEMLPSLQMADLQLKILYLIGSVYYTRLGDYEDNAFGDSRVRPLFQAFQTGLREVEEQINRRNLQREIRYTYLLPSKSPMSINI